MDTNSFSLHHNILSPPPPPPHIYHKPYSFYWGKESEFLFSGWPDNNTGMYALALIFIFTLAILVEFLSGLNLVKPGSSRAGTIFFQAGIQAIRAGFGYMVVLAVASYNGGVFIVAFWAMQLATFFFGAGSLEKIRTSLKVEM